MPVKYCTVKCPLFEHEHVILLDWRKFLPVSVSAVLTRLLS